jgi:5-methylcytosine-specific restriction enzyme subunit McrC
MNDRIIFGDLVGLADPTRTLSADEDRWLTTLAAETDPAQHTIELAPTCASTDPQPILHRQLDGSWRAGRYVGELHRAGRVLEIRPRLGIDVIATWASAALNLHTIPHTAENKGTSTLIAELVAALWRSTLTTAGRHGPPGVRGHRHHEGNAVRGQLDIAGTIRLRTAHSPLLASVERAKMTDNPVSRVIVLADRALNRRLHHRPTWRGERIQDIVGNLRAATGARPQLPTRHELDRVRYTPMTLPYRRAAELSWQIARHKGPRADATADDTHGLLIDVAELWELFLLHCARRASDDTVTHGTHLHRARPLLRSQAHPTATLGRLYPDLLIGPSEQPHTIVDAKYKPLADPRGVDREDLYQITSYLTGHALSGTRPTGVLAYPHFREQSHVADAERHSPWATPNNQQVRFVRLPITEIDCVQALASLL